jgi:type IV pilus assembly protein PilW
MTGKQRAGGFSIIELMVGMVIAILSSIVVYQVFSVSERQKRTTTGAADAQSNGAIAFYMLDRDIKMAGWGIENTGMANCTNLYTYLDDGASAGPITDMFASVSIVDGGTGPDTINIQYYDDPAKANYKFAVTVLGASMPQPSSELKVESTYGCQADIDTHELPLAFLIQGGNCTLIKITHIQAPALQLQHAPGGTPTYNPPAAYQNANGWPAYTKGATLQCFPNLFRRTYRITNENLELRQPDSAGATQTYQVAPEIVDLQAQYGIAPAGSQQVTQWVDATDAWASPLTTANIYRIKAVRIALVARSAQFEKPDASGTCTTTDAAAVDNWSSWANFSTSNLPADWQCYRYKVFETVVPLRNIIWANV